MIKTWKERLDWNARLSPNNAQRMKAMEDEIKELRQSIGLMRGQVNRARKAADNWERKYDVLLLELRKVLKGK